MTEKFTERISTDTVVLDLQYGFPVRATYRPHLQLQHSQKPPEHKGSRLGLQQMSPRHLPHSRIDRRKQKCFVFKK